MVALIRHTKNLKRILWTNPKEIPGNGIDDDKNGYVDDIHGWNFLGGKDGKNVEFETAEVTREYVRLKPSFDGKDRASLSPAQQKEYDRYLKLKTEVESKRAEYQQQYESISRFNDQYLSLTENLQKSPWRS